MAAKLNLHVVLLESIDQRLIDRAQFRHYEQLLWGDRVGLVGAVRDRWLKWNAINKELLNEDYPKESLQQEKA